MFGNGVEWRKWNEIVANLTNVIKKLLKKKESKNVLYKKVKNLVL
jgi:hypothetical protein